VTRQGDSTICLATQVGVSIGDVQSVNSGWNRFYRRQQR